MKPKAFEQYISSIAQKYSEYIDALHAEFAVKSPGGSPINFDIYERDDMLYKVAFKDFSDMLSEAGYPNHYRVIWTTCGKPSYQLFLNK